MKEILGGNLDQVFVDLNIKATKTYQSKSDKTDFTQVWELSDEDFEKLCNIQDGDWKDAWGWWRSAEGSNIIGSPTHIMIINHQDILAYYNDDKLEQYIEYILEDSINDFGIKEEAREQLIKDYFNEECIYMNFTNYCSRQWGASTEKNVCAIGVETAKLNGITLGELFNKYQG